MAKVVIFDGNAIMHRAFHALPPMTTPNGAPINAVYGLVSMLYKVIFDLRPTHIIFAFDRPEPTFRKRILKSYQAHRPEMDESLSPQFEKAHEIIQSFKIPIYSKAGFEADDVIGTIANMINKNILIVTGDRDMLQLVQGKTKLYMPGKGLSDATEYGPRETRERMGVPPEQIVDYKALVGDPSDNYKGVPGIGPKTAVSLLGKYYTLDNIYSHVSEIKESVAKKLIEHKTSAYQSQKLAKIVTDVDIDFKLGNAREWNLYNPGSEQVFKTFGFRSLAKRAQDIEQAKLKETQQNLF
ncbi:hypothetical protein C4564_02285 [Candidatus Microgenomates bacterium]|nr:MAG: hypothetical protein C4564_02285 [Candidatus Microgenomates bacterium]